MKKQPSIMDRLNNPILTILVLTLFIVLATRSCEEKHSHEPGYTLSEIKAKNALIDKALAEYKHPRPMDARLMTMSVWGLTEADVSKPVNIFASNGVKK